MIQNRWHHVGLDVQNSEVSRIFYEDFFSFVSGKRFTFRDEQVLFMENNGVTLELIESSIHKTCCSFIHFSFEVENLEERVNELAELGLEPSEGPIIVEDLKLVFYQGPDQEWIELVEKSQGRSK